MRRRHPNHEHYEVNEDGDVFSMGRTITYVRNGGVHSRYWSERQMTPSLDWCGYRVVNLKGVPVKICVLVLETFVGPCPEEFEVLHQNDVKTDDRLSNLRWGERADNIEDAFRNGNLPSGERHRWAKLSDGEVKEIRASELRASAAAARHGVSVGHIYAIRAGARRRFG